MQTASVVHQSEKDARYRLGWISFLIGVLGAGVIPVMIVVAANSYSTPDAADYVRMAFASVAAGTLAVSSITAVLLLERVGTGSIRIRMIVLWLIVASTAYSTIVPAHDRLVALLG